jgi:hypothetical protein
MNTKKIRKLKKIKIYNELLCGNLIRHNFSISKINVCLECKFIKDKG